MAATEQVILVDKFDKPLGTAEKLYAHQEGLCHRAFSVMVFRKNPSIEVLIQQRASKKYHSPNLWTNTCCSHPRPGEETVAAANRRLYEEFGLTLPLKSIGSFHYTARFGNGLTENEFDHVLIGEYEHQLIAPNPEEIQDYRWVGFDDLKKDMAKHPERYTPWFGQVVEMTEGHFSE